MPDREPIKIIADIIKSEMTLDDTQVIIFNQRYQIPTFSGIFIFLQYLNSKVVANNNYYEDSESGLTEIQQAVIAHDIQIDVMSANSEARERKEEVILALNSMKAQEWADKYEVKIATIPTAFTNTSEIEETARMNRFTTNMTMIGLYEKSKAAAYYDTFEDDVIYHD